MSAIRTNAAAAMLGVSANTLRSWERRFGFPMPRRSAGGHRQFDLTEIEALRQGLAETQNISSAIAVARARGEGLAAPTSLRAALATFDEPRADRLLEESLAVRSVERTIEALLLPAIAALEAGSAEQRFAWRYASGWMAALQRTCAPATLPAAIVIFEATDAGDLDALAAQALELFARRAGLRALSLPMALEPARVARAMRALEPDAVVLAGTRAGLDALGQLVYVARQSRPGVEVFDFGGAVPDSGASTVRRLGDSPSEAVATLRGRLLGEASSRPRELRVV
jgi:DNA-binding transcriptional MerR regulator